MTIDHIGHEMHRIGRRITGSGIGGTPRTLSRHVRLETCEGPSGTRLFDWIAPGEGA